MTHKKKLPKLRIGSKVAGRKANKGLRSATKRGKKALGLARIGGY